MIIEEIEPSSVLYLVERKSTSPRKRMSTVGMVIMDRELTCIKTSFCELVKRPLKFTEIGHYHGEDCGPAPDYPTCTYTGKRHTSETHELKNKQTVSAPKVGHYI